MSDEREVLTWELFGTATRELAGQVADLDPEDVLAAREVQSFQIWVVVIERRNP